MTHQREIIFASFSGLIAVVAIVAMPLLVAKPKLLFGRSLSAISPTLFPYVILVVIAMLSLGLLIVAYRQLVAHRRIINDTPQTPTEDENNWLNKGLFFVLLVGYGLLLKPLGFLISSSLVIGATSLLLGNRNWLQIALLAVVSPICLYLIATRAMLVSLPELDQIELLYSHLIRLFRGVTGQ